jgi:cyclopropane fatty-acyl-phospholipid synthase-like methyltransferase
MNTMSDKPYAESCDRNRDAILAVIGPLLTDHKSVLEIGSGTGQHAVYFAQHMPYLRWHTSDLEDNLEGIRLWLDQAGLDNTPAPITLDVNHPDWPGLDIDAVFCANVVHIIGWREVEAMFAGIGRLLPTGGLLMLYGPFNYNNKYTSDSNERFDAWLRARDPSSGIRNFEDVNALAERAGLALVRDYEMPANNRILCWKKLPVP